MTLPGDKSISHRAAMIAAIAAGTTEISNYSPSEDCSSTLDCLQQLGVTINTTGQVVSVHGSGLLGLQPPPRPLDAGNSGTTIRLLSGILAGQPFETIITGDASIRRRPMGRIIDPLTLMGARISAAQGGRAPLHIRGGTVRPITYPLPVASAQVKSCVLLAGLYAAGATTVIEPTPTRNHTEIMLSHFGAQIRITGGHILVNGPACLSGTLLRVPGDTSSAAFFIAAALVVPDSELELKDVGLNPTRTGFIDLLQRLGASIEVRNRRTWQGEPVADLVVRSSQIHCAGPVTIAGDMIPLLIDEVPILAVLATHIHGGLSLRGARELRVKESDRLSALAENLRRMGAQIVEYDDGLAIPGPQKLHGARIDSFGDHRIAMAFSIAGLAAAGSTEIESSDVVGVSFPTFYQLLEKVSVP